MDAKPVFRYLSRSFGMQLDIKERKSMIFDFTTEELRDGRGPANKACDRELRNPL